MNSLVKALQSKGSEVMAWMKTHEPALLNFVHAACKRLYPAPVKNSNGIFRVAILTTSGSGKPFSGKCYGGLFIYFNKC